MIDKTKLIDEMIRLIRSSKLYDDSLLPLLPFKGNNLLDERLRLLRTSCCKSHGFTEIVKTVTIFLCSQSSTCSIHGQAAILDIFHLSVHDNFSRLAMVSLDDISFYWIVILIDFGLTSYGRYISLSINV